MDLKAYKTEEIRNIGIVGHSGKGKTTLAEAMLFESGAIDRMGKVEDGSTVSDYDPEETKRGISISASVMAVEHRDCKINVIDVPGYFDFEGELAEAMTVMDGAVLVISGASGVAVGFEKAWERCEAAQLPRMIFVNKLDKENASFDKTVAALQERYGTAIVPLQLPIKEGGKLTGYVDVISGKAMLFDGKKEKEAPVPEDMQGALEAALEVATEAAAEGDDELIEKFFAGEALTLEEIVRGLRERLNEGKIVPVLGGVANQNLGVLALMNAIVTLMPNPAERPELEAEDVSKHERIKVKMDSDGHLCARVFKTVADPYVGKLSLFKVMSGTVRSDAPMYNVNAEKTGKMSGLYILQGKRQIPTDAIASGDIGAIAKLQVTNTGDTLSTVNHPRLFDPIVFPEPALSMAVTVTKQGDEDKAFSGLHRLEEEDPTIRVTKGDGGETLLSGLGEMHLEIIVKKLANKFGAQVKLSDPRIPYKETIRKKVKAEGRHKKQTGGHGQFGHVWIEFEPIVDGSAEFEFVDKVVGGVVPRQYIPAVEKGLRECITKGVLAGFPVVNIRCTLYDGSFHPVDSSEMAFKVAAALAFKKGCQEANPVLLEPIYHVEITVPDEYMGDIIGDMNRRRGRIMGMNPIGKLQQIVAEVPEAEMFKYATDLRSMTQARGSFTMSFERYEEVPAQMAQKIIEAHQKEEE